MIKAVIDTNVFISSFWGGKPGKIIELWRDGKIQLCLSDEILKEYLRVMYRLNLSQERVTKLISLLGEKQNITDVNPQQHFHVIQDDPDDNIFIDCAFEGKAEFIISGDKHLLKLRNFKKILKKVRKT